MSAAAPAPDFPPGLFGSPFRPAWWLRNPHAQTLFSSFFRQLPPVARERETVALPDGDFLDFDWQLPPGWREDRPLVLVVHGLSGSSDSHYVLGLQAALSAGGWGSAALNCRGAARPNNLARAYHAGASDDLQQALLHMAQRFPRAPRAVVGYSLGGNMTLKLLGETAGAPPVFAGVAVSAPCCCRCVPIAWTRACRASTGATSSAPWSGTGKKKCGIWNGPASARRRAACRSS